MIILLAVIASMATSCFTFLLYVATQEGQIFGKWQRVLDRLSEKDSFWTKPFGACEICWCQMWAVISYFIFAALLAILYPLSWYEYPILYICYWPITSVSSLKLMKSFK